MFDSLDVFRMANAMATHAGARQGVIARNMANADTPGYAAQDIRPFRVEAGGDTGPGVDTFRPRATRETHLNAPPATAAFAVSDRPDARADPNGNSVSLESEMLHAVDTKRQHDRAMAIYRSSLDVLRTAIGRR
jgi:flagellar basal-body rod protein FlgB